MNKLKQILTLQANWYESLKNTKTINTNNLLIKLT